MNENKEKAVAEADAATDRLQKGLRAAKLIVSDYRAKLCRKLPDDRRSTDGKSIFQFDG